MNNAFIVEEWKWFWYKLRWWAKLIMIPLMVILTILWSIIWLVTFITEKAIIKDK